ncbi:ribosomal protein S6 kinase-like 1 isoform X2 [Microcaecilia unicolor]|uniref:Ribosomal protein S6 kinase-like 1 isoform X2 n=1 Tax=Microcaecilia unicolor TaxID=1415580 RepID=A0A6P7YVP6_9AMPH|nr:ribosomal protein S6 kinase-like 1 isoform X2 [Microcaecilia unicolor]
MNCGSRDHCQDSEVETRPRAPSRARQYLEQIRSCVTVSVSDVQKWDYLVDAAKQIRLALEHDVGENYEEAFNFYKNGVDLLLSGLQVDCNTERREAVKLKISQYLKRAEEIFNCHLQKNLGNGPDAVDGYNSLRFRPVRILCSAVENLKPCKVLRIIDKVQLVQDPCTGATFILKSLPKSQLERRKQQTIIPQGVPFMVTLLCYYTSEDAVILQLEHVEGHIRLTYFGQWTEVEPQYCSQALENLYAAPEILGVSTVTQACDWWSLGALLYELLTGMSLSQNHRSGIHPHTGLLLPDSLSSAASSLLSELLQYDPDHRLGSGVDGISKIKAHPFFSTIKWNKLL